MIEFIIPLNLPVRAVEISATTANPSESIRREIARSAEAQPWDSTGSHESPLSFPSPIGYRSAGVGNQREPSKVQQELESLRLHRTLFAEAVNELRHATTLVEKQLAQTLLEFQEVAIELAHAIATKLVFEEVDDNRFPIANLVHEVVSRLDSSANAVVRLHPEDLALVEELDPIQGAGNEHSVRFIADSTLARGDCKAKAGEISVIYELRRQVDEIRRQLLSTVSGHAET